jgi:dihydrolipoamide dehydrogenase
MAWRQALGERLIVNDDVFDWQDLPRSVAVVGTGVIGLELAQALHRLGVRVRLYGRSRPPGPADRPGAAGGRRAGVRARTAADAGPRHLVPRREGDEVVVRVTGPVGEVHEERFDWLLAATGRRPNVDALGLEHTGCPWTPAGVPLHDPRTGQIASTHVFIAGDVAEDRPLLHEAADDGRIAGDNAGRWPDVRVRPRRAPLAVVFSDPQIAIAGASHAELLARRHRLRHRRACRSRTRAAAA